MATPYSLTATYKKRFPQDTAVRFSYVPAIRAVLALHRNQPAHAIQILESASLYESGVQRTSIHGNFGALYPAYVRGTAFLAQSRGAEVSTESQKVLNHRGIVISDPVGVFARLQLARALTQAGNRTSAKTAYEELLNTWKNSDAVLPVRDEARTEYSSLR